MQSMATRKGLEVMNTTTVEVWVCYRGEQEKKGGWRKGEEAGNTLGKKKEAIQRAQRIYNGGKMHV